MSEVDQIVGCLVRGVGVGNADDVDFGQVLHRAVDEDHSDSEPLQAFPAVEVSTRRCRDHGSDRPVEECVERVRLEGTGSSCVVMRTTWRS